MPKEHRRLPKYEENVRRTKGVKQSRDLVASRRATMEKSDGSDDDMNSADVFDNISKDDIVYLPDVVSNDFGEDIEDWRQRNIAASTSAPSELAAVRRANFTRISQRFAADIAQKRILQKKQAAAAGPRNRFAALMMDDDDDEDNSDDDNDTLTRKGKAPPLLSQVSDRTLLQLVPYLPIPSRMHFALVCRRFRGIITEYRNVTQPMTLPEELLKHIVSFVHPLYLHRATACLNRAWHAWYHHEFPWMRYFLWRGWTPTGASWHDQVLQCLRSEELLEMVPLPKHSVELATKIAVSSEMLNACSWDRTRTLDPKHLAEIVLKDPLKSDFARLVVSEGGSDIEGLCGFLHLPGAALRSHLNRHRPVLPMRCPCCQKRRAGWAINGVLRSHWDYSVYAQGRQVEVTDNDEEEDQLLGVGGVIFQCGHYFNRWWWLRHGESPYER
eukprot:TRINITY_DN2817_c0_g3_i1.p1 TRINITY_DN2817_c0_g3~~TRINITY_DN2817_c0_g3_i1.p1  ORF type:complete len:442 (+),score=72.20 TRINITY_DN2817_c0_g3_i1:118-1443(+)